MTKKNILFIKQERAPTLKQTRFVVNWGSSNNTINIANCTVLNNADSVRVASNKLLTFIAFSANNVSCPEYTTDIETAIEWVNNNTSVVCRRFLSSHSGNGIVIANNENSLVNAPLYTKYIKKKKEFRVHVFNNNIIDIQEKRKSSDAVVVDYNIRNHAGGFVFCRDGILEPTDLKEVAISAVQSLNLDFGAVDIIWNEHYNKCYALEVNTAPGLEGTTLNAYVNAIVTASRQ